MKQKKHLHLFISKVSLESTPGNKQFTIERKMKCAHLCFFALLCSSSSFLLPLWNNVYRSHLCLFGIVDACTHSTCRAGSFWFVDFSLSLPRPLLSSSSVPSTSPSRLRKQLQVKLWNHLKIALQPSKGLPSPSVSTFYPVLTLCKNDRVNKPC